MYQALYRKWRPRTFDEVVGQSHITETLKRQVAADRLSHAYLFIGTRGTGKTSCARILAKAVNCENPQNGNPCNVCRFCRGIDDGSLMDVVELDAASNNGVDNVRQLRDEAIFSPASARKRVYIIDEVHMLSGPAFNALLKILEEPPEHLMFILATTELQKVPATILSRCQRHAFKRLDAETIVARLRYVADREGLDLRPEAAALIAGLSEGGMRDALSMLDQCSGRDRIDTETVYSAMGLAGNQEIAALLRSIAAGDSAAAIGSFERLWQNGKDPATLLGELSGLLRDLLLRAVAPKGGSALLSGAYDAATLDGFREAFPTAALVAMIDCIQTALADMRSGQARTVCELCILSLCEPGLSDSLPMLRRRVAALEARLREGIPAAAVPAVPEPRPAVPEPEPTVPEPMERDLPPFDPDPVPAPPPPWEIEPPLPEKSPEPTPREAPAEQVSAEAPIELPAEAPATAPDAAGEKEDFWARVRAKLEPQLPRGIRDILCDPTQVGARLCGDELRLRLDNPFAQNMIDRPDLLGKIAKAAGELRGAETKVRVGDEPDAPGAATPQPERSKLEALKQFSVVTFK